VRRWAVAEQQACEWHRPMDAKSLLLSQQQFYTRNQELNFGSGSTWVGANHIAALTSGTQNMTGETTSFCIGHTQRQGQVRRTFHQSRSCNYISVESLITVPSTRLLKSALSKQVQPRHPDSVSSRMRQNARTYDSNNPALQLGKFLCAQVTCDLARFQKKLRVSSVAFFCRLFRRAKGTIQNDRLTGIEVRVRQRRGMTLLENAQNLYDSVDLDALDETAAQLLLLCCCFVGVRGIGLRCSGCSG